GAATDAGPATDGGAWPGMRARGWPASALLRTARLTLEPVSAAHAPAMVPVLADPALYAVIGGEPPDLDALGRRYARWEHPVSDDGTEAWLNWVIVTGDGPAGTVQATVTDGGTRANLAWVIGTAFQGRGLATEAARAMAAWLTARGVTEFLADIEPGHGPSERVARRLGLRPTPELVDGETRWVARATEMAR
ncbi:MAG TPA: GNAT family N-acetyltransferase, partial [Pseudonocardiaceae bacterium]